MAFGKAAVLLLSGVQATDNQMFYATDVDPDNSSVYIDNETLEWHFEPDYITKLLLTDLMPPFWLIPFFFGTKLMVTMVAFGFSLRFKPKPDPPKLHSFGWFKEKAILVAKNCAITVSILACLKGYYMDLKKIVAILPQVETFGQQLGVILVVWVTSANYVAFRAFWDTLAIENPSNLFGMEPLYLGEDGVLEKHWGIGCLPFKFLPDHRGIPLPRRLPFFHPEVSWLTHAKYLYGLCLLPYMAPLVTVFVLQSFSGCILGCMMCCGCLAYKLFFSSLCCIVTLGLVAMFSRWATWYWIMFEPMILQAVYQFIALTGIPLIMAFLFSILIGCSSENFAKAVSKWYVRNNTLFGGLAQELDDDDSIKLRRYNKDKLADFKEVLKEGLKERLIVIDPDDEAPTIGEAKDEEAKADEEAKDAIMDGTGMDDTGASGCHTLDDAKVFIFIQTLSNMASIAMHQIATIYAARLLVCDITVDAYLGALAQTLDERTLGNYWGTVEEKIAKAGVFAGIGEKILMKAFFG